MIVGPARRIAGKIGGIRSSASIRLKEALNKSPLARRRLCGMGCAKGDDANGAAAQGGAVSSERKMRPRSEMPAPQQTCGAVEASPPLPDPRSAGLLGRRSGGAPWHRSPGYDLRRAPYDHSDFTSNALSADLFSAS